jgi:DNA-binding response OmpR family regulator
MANILIVDDEMQLREMLRIVLEDAGHCVREAADGHEALKSYFDQPVDLVVTDIIMPNKEGTEIILELRRSHSDVKIVAMSGGGRNSSQDYLKLAKKFGANMTLAKPFTNQEFLDAINAALATSVA